MQLLANTIQAIQIGVEDFTTNESGRVFSAVKNVYAGILLRAKRVDFCTVDT